MLYAGVGGAFAQPAADVVALLDLDPARAAVDGHLQLPPLAAAPDVLGTQLDDMSAVDRAVGVLLDRGLLPPTARELHRLATMGGQRPHSSPGAARRHPAPPPRPVAGRTPNDRPVRRDRDSSASSLPRHLMHPSSGGAGCRRDTGPAR